MMLTFPILSLFAAATRGPRGTLAIARSARRVSIACLLLLLLIGSASTPAIAQEAAGTIEEGMPPLVEKLPKQLVAKEQPKVVALDFTDIQGRPNELGHYLAEQLSVDMVMAEGITVVDRANLEAMVVLSR